jgi:hypothetical protein
MNVKADISWVKDVTGEFEYADPWARFTEIAAKVIETVAEDDQGMAIRFTDGSRLCIWDGGQSCCESRYMTCDDDLSGHEGGQLISIDTEASGAQPADEKADDDDDEWSTGDCHEVQFVKVQTTKGSFTLCTHNSHNGYYGGFSLRVKLHR